MYSITHIIQSHMVINRLLKVRLNGENEPPADAPKAAANATALLGRYGYTSDDITALGTADEAKIGEMFTARHTALEADVIARKGKEIASRANFDGVKHGYTKAEERILSRAKELGLEIGEDDLSTLEEKTRLEGIVSAIYGKLKAAAPGSENEKALQLKLESTLKGQADVQKELKATAKERDELKASIPTIKEQIQAEYFAEREWTAIATKPETLQTLSIQDRDVLINLIHGNMASKGHKFIAEKGTDGFRLQVVDKDGAYIQMTGAAGNHSPETYINQIYAPLVKKSNAGQNGNGSFTFETGGADSKLSSVGNDAVRKMAEQAAAARQ